MHSICMLYGKTSCLIKINKTDNNVDFVKVTKQQIYKQQKKKTKNPQYVFDKSNLKYLNIYHKNKQLTLVSKWGFR